MASNGITSTGTCIAFSATAPTTFDDNATTGYPSLTYTAAAEMLSVGELGGERAVSSYVTQCDGKTHKTLGEIDNGTQSIELAFDIDNAAQVILQNAFDNNTKIYARETLSSGDVYYYTANVSSSKVNASGSDVVKWTGSLVISGDLVAVAA